MKYKLTIMLLAGIATVFLSSVSFCHSQVKKAQPFVAGDTIKKVAVIDSADGLPLKLKSYKQNVHASYYADKFNGRSTASGSKFNNSHYTAAHRKFPFGTKLKVTNKENGKFVIVEVTDRGPFVKGREIDLTRRAFKDICDNKTCGGLKVTIDVVSD